MGNSNDTEQAAVDALMHVDLRFCFCSIFGDTCITRLSSASPDPVLDCFFSSFFRHRERVVWRLQCKRFQ